VDTQPRPPLLKRLPAGARTALIWCAAAAYPLALLAAVTLENHRPGQPAQLLLAALVATLPLGLLRRRPVLVMALLLAGALAGAIVAHPPEIPYLQFVAVDVALGFVAAICPRRISIAAAVLALGVLAIYASVDGRLAVLSFALDRFRGSSLIVVALTIVVAWMTGNSIRQRRDYARTLRAQAMAQAVTAERLRIARELHDLVAHSVGIIAIQAGVGSRVMDTQPAEARKALSAIEATSRETLGGLRRMLGALRQAGPGSASGPAPLHPAPGLADLSRLVATAADASVRVDVQWQGKRRLLPAEVDLSAFRIIQEAVTNVVRHAGTGHCQVAVDYRDEELSIEIIDDGRGCLDADTGYGLIGMRERVGLLDGHFTAGPRPEGGFCVAARLPLPAVA
jgi:signal transduction histidine kinase